MGLPTIVFKVGKQTFAITRSKPGTVFAGRVKAGKLLRGRPKRFDASAIEDKLTVRNIVRRAVPAG
jgi:hypothetical protein